MCHQAFTAFPLLGDVAMFW